MAIDTKYKDSTESLKVEYKIVGERIKKIVPVHVHNYSLDSAWAAANVGTPGIGTPSADYLLKEWIDSEKGQWVVKHTQRTPEFIRGYHAVTYEIMIQIVAFLYEEDATMYHLKWS
jgi:hypothetical protein